MPFLPPNQQCQLFKANAYYSCGIAIAKKGKHRKISMCLPWLWFPLTFPIFPDHFAIPWLSRFSRWVVTLSVSPSFSSVKTSDGNKARIPAWRYRSFIHQHTPDGRGNACFINYKRIPVRKGISSFLVRSTPSASAIVDNFLILFKRSWNKTQCHCASISNSTREIQQTINVLTKTGNSLLWLPEL